MLKIGELARRAGCLVETIRFYEREGVLPAPARSAGNYRLYDEKLVRRLEFIRQCRSLDMSLDEVRQLLDMADAPGAPCKAVDAIIDHHIEQVLVRIRDLDNLKVELQKLRSNCRVEGLTDECGILKQLSKRSERV